MVVDVHNMMQQRALLFEQLKVAEAMQFFISHCLGGSEDLCSRLERSNVDLVIA